jgi:hypothetical protein
LKFESKDLPEELAEKAEEFNKIYKKLQEDVSNSV